MRVGTVCWLKLEILMLPRLRFTVLENTEQVV